MGIFRISPGWRLDDQKRSHQKYCVVMKNLNKLEIL